MKVALVSGGASGLGRATAKRFDAAEARCGAVLSTMKVAARESAALGMTVNAIAPGSIDTPMLTQILGGDTAAIAGAADVTGATIDVNGGVQMR